MSKPIYDIDKTYLYNATHGPFFDGEIPKFPFSRNETELFGYKLNNPLGVPAGPLLNSKWTHLASQLGYSYITYKTIRSSYHPSHALPNVAFVKWSEEPTLYTAADDKELSITNSFGMPSMPLDFLAEDITRALDLVQKGQLLSVSITGTESTHTPFVKDLCYLIRFLNDLHVPVIEVNFSCPNVLSGGDDLYLDEEAIETIGRELVKSAQGTPLVLKVSTYPSEDKLSSCLIAMARAGFQGVCGINSVKKNVCQQDGSYALGKSRPQSGICGQGILADATTFIKRARSCIEQNHLDLNLIGTGGITQAKDFDKLLDSGATLALTATGMMWDPLLASKYLTQSQQLVGSPQ